MRLNRQKIKQLLSLLVLLSFAVCGNTQTNNAQNDSNNDTTRYYRRHIVICIDRAMRINPEGRDSIYSALEALLLQREMPRWVRTSSRQKYIYRGDVLFDPSRDEISLFYTAGIEGQGNPPSGVWGKINSCAINAKISPQEMNSMIDNYLINDAGTFSASGLSAEDFVIRRIKPLLNSNATLGDKVTLTSCIYPLILNHIEKKPATEYVLFIVSDYKGGGGSNLESGDDRRLIEMIGKSNSRHYYENFWDYIHELDTLFYFQRDNVEMEYVSSVKYSTYKFTPKITGGELVPVALDGNSFETYSFSLVQKSYGSDVYKIVGAQVRMTPNPRVKINRIDIEITDHLGNLLKVVSVNDGIDELYSDGVFRLDKGKRDELLVDLWDKNVDDCVFSYVVYTTILDKNGDILVPLVRKGNVHPAIIMASAPKPKLLFVIICLSVILVGLLLRLIYVRRGKKAIPDIDIDVIPISNTRYMDVEKCEVKNYDCWYIEDENDKSRQIRFKVRLTPPNKSFAQKHRFFVKFQVEDIDCNDNFTFQPHGKHQDGTQWQLNTLYPLPKLYDISKTPVYEANIDVDAFVTTDGQINFGIDNILETKLTVSLFMQENGREIKVKSSDKYYKFIVKPKLRNSNVWVAFDAGTSGATVAYGITGNWLDKDEINLVQHEIMEAGNTKTKSSAIFPSVVSIPDTSKAFLAPSMKAEDYSEDTDFLFGVDAEKESYNKFQSIKKFLGYKSPQKIVQQNGGKTSEISGQDLAHLLVKGMYGQLEASVRNNKNEDTRNQFYNSLEFDPQRAVVAVPNSYTLNKVQDMVSSVKRLGKFKEVHYLYESEGVMMTYLRKSLPVLKEKQDRTFVVFDMGGATINITAFTLQLRLGKNGNIHKISLTSPAKIGYYVGGDDIDYALIQFVYSIPTVRHIVSEQIAEEKGSSVLEKDILEHQKAHKNILIDISRKIKLDWIDVCNGEALNDNIMVSIPQFWSYLRAYITKNMDLELPNEPTDDDMKFIRSEKEGHRIMNRYVYSHISDALSELLKSPKFPANTQIELILSGRSVLYPKVKDTILKSFKGRTVSLWNGFFKDGTEKFDDQKVKTVVAEGACWYAMYSRDIELKHNYVTSSYGFEDRSDNKKCYHELIENGREFNLHGRCECEIHEEDLFDPNINDIKFLQMMGADANKIVQNDIRHKKNLLDEVKPDQIKTAIEKITFAVDDKGNFEYEVYLRGFEKAITKESTRAYRHDKDIQNEIKDENSPAYEFATTNTSTYASSASRKAQTIPMSKVQQQNKVQHRLK